MPFRRSTVAGVLHRRVDRGGHLVEDRRRRALGRVHAGPVRDAQLAEALLGGGRQLGIGRDAAGPGVGQGLELAALEVGQRDDAGLGRGLDLACRAPR